MRNEKGGRSALIGGMLAASAIGAAWAVDARRRSDRLRRTHRILVDLLLNALTADDPVTARHSRRVADLSYALAEAVGMRGSELTTLRVAALLHDLGKIDDRFWHIVHSRKRLTPEERSKIEQHPDQSARILEPLGAIHPGLDAIVASHHECWDGDGYPAGLRGDAIPLGARIIAIADVFDALTQPRKYRDPLRPEEAIEKLVEGSGRQFDPALVELVSAPHFRQSWFELARRGLADEESVDECDKSMVEHSEER